MTKLASIIVSKRFGAAAALLFVLALAQASLASCEPDEFAPIPASVVHP